MCRIQNMAMMDASRSVHRQGTEQGGLEKAQDAKLHSRSQSPGNGYRRLQDKFAFAALAGTGVESQPAKLRAKIAVIGDEAGSDLRWKGNGVTPCAEKPVVPLVADSVPAYRDFFLPKQHPERSRAETVHPQADIQDNNRQAANRLMSQEQKSRQQKQCIGQKYPGPEKPVADESEPNMECFVNALYSAAPDRSCINCIHES